MNNNNSKECCICYETECDIVLLHKCSHNLCINEAFERLFTLYNNYHLKEVFVTNSIPQTDEFKKLSFISEYCLAETFSRAIYQIQSNMVINHS